MAAMNKEKSASLESVGWVFYCIVFGVVLAPAIILAWQISYERATRMLPIGLGIAIAAIVAGMITWLVNSVLQWRAEKRRKAERKKAKKRK